MGFQWPEKVSLMCMSMISPITFRFFIAHIYIYLTHIQGVFHIHIQARQEEDVETSIIMEKIRGLGGGARYVDHNVANPSLANAYKPRPQAPILTPGPEAASPEPPKPLFSPPTSSYQPIKTAPKPLAYTAQSIQAPVHEAEAPKALYAPATSSYQPIKTAPKPLNAPSAFQQPSNIPFVVEKPAYQSLASRAQTFNQPQQSVAGSSYQPIKLTPKPLYEEGTATKAYVALETGRSSTTRTSTSARTSTTSYVPPSRPSVTSSTADAATRRVEEQRKQEEKLAQQRREENQASSIHQQEGSGVSERMAQMRLKEDQARAEQAAREEQAATDRERQESRGRRDDPSPEQNRINQQREKEASLKAAAEIEKERHAAAAQRSTADQIATAIYDYTPGTSP
jgi:hypothetical protein